MIGHLGRRHPDLELTLLVFSMAIVGGFGLAALRYAIEVTTK